MESRTLISEAILAGGKLVKVLCCIRDCVAIEAHDDPTERLAALLDVEVDFLGDGSVAHGD